MGRLALCVVLVLADAGQATATIHTFDFDSGLGANFSLCHFLYCGNMLLSERLVWTVENVLCLRGGYRHES